MGYVFPGLGIKGIDATIAEVGECGRITVVKLFNRPRQAFTIRWSGSNIEPAEFCVNFLD